MKRTVFISHSSADKAIAEQVCSFLETHGVVCWIAPRDVTPGKNYGAAILDAIDECSVFVLILTSESNKSGQVVREVERAASSDSILIPFRVEDVKPSRNLEFYVSSAHWLDAVSKPLDKHLRELLKAIRDWQQSDDSKEKEKEPATPPPSEQPPVPAQPPPLQRFAAARFPISPPMAAAAGGAILLVAVLGYFVLRHPPSRPARPAAIPAASVAPLLQTEVPSPAPTGALTLSPAAVSSSTPALISPLPMESISPTSAPVRRRPGEPLKSSTVPETQPSVSAAPSPSSAGRRPGQPLVTGSPSASPASSAPVVREVAASSELHLKNEVRKASLAFDGDLTTSWAPVGDGVDQSLSVHFKAPANIATVSIIAATGNDSQFRFRNRIHTLRLTLSDGSNQVLTFEDRPKWQRFELRKPVTADWAKFDILTVYRGRKMDHTPIFEISFNREP